MNNLNQFIANIYVVMLNIRDTLQFCLPMELDEALYNARKEGITSGYAANSALKHFLDDNKEKGADIEKKLKEFVEEIYGENSTVLKVNNGKVRVDHTQHLKMYEYIVGLNETLRDVIYQYLIYSKQQNMFEECMEKLIKTDEALYRAIAYKFIYADLEKCFVEFNKIMAENQGKPSPQANFIIQNEFAKYASQLRFIRQHCHLIDNKTLDMMDDALEVLEMLEGRRERRDERQFPELIKGVRENFEKYIGDAEKAWREAYEPILKEMIELVNKQNANKKDTQNVNEEGNKDEENKA